MGLVAIVADPLTEPVPAGWDEFVAVQRLLPIWDSRLLSAVAWCAQAPSSLVMIEEAGSSTPVAVFHARHRGLTNPCRFVAPGRAPALSLIDCGTFPVAAGEGFAFAAGTDRRDKIEAVRTFERALHQRAGPGGLAIAYRRLRDRHLPVIPRVGRIRLRLNPRMVLHNRWPDLAAYFGSLTGKWRSQLRRIHLTVDADHTLRVDLVREVSAQDACWLAEVVRRRHTSRLVPRPPLPALYLERFMRLPGSRFLVYRDKQDRLVAFSAVYDTGTELLLIYWGARSRADGWRQDLYFDQYVRLVDMMVRTGRERLVLGAGMARIKSRYGARPEPRWGLVGWR
jgi:hypothetical protein